MDHWLEYLRWEREYRQSELDHEEHPVDDLLGDPWVDIGGEG